MLYTGHLYHASSGMYLAPYRAYDSALGRWLNREPAGRDAPNLYAYVQNSPFDAIDPTGLYTEIIILEPSSDVIYKPWKWASLWGHVATRVNDCVYSYTHSGWSILTVDYFNSPYNLPRPKYGFVLPITPEQEQALIEAFEKNIDGDPKYDYWNSTCSGRTYGPLNDVFDLGWFVPGERILPKDLYDWLSKIIPDPIYYPPYRPIH